MEELLSQIVVISNNFFDIRKAAQEAVDLLRVQQGLIRDSPYELRQKCLLPLQLCLETKKHKFTALAVSGFHKMIRDDRFHSCIEPDDDTKWLPMQLLQGTKCTLSLNDDTQIDILKVYLSIGKSNKWVINGRAVILVICFCSEIYDVGSCVVKETSKAAAIQILHSFCFSIKKKVEDTADTSHFNEILPLMQFICSKINETEGSSHCENGIVFLLECLLALCSSLPKAVSSNNYIKTFFWQKLCPILISIIGTPIANKNLGAKVSGPEKELGKGSSTVNIAPNFNNVQIKTVYSITVELVRLFGNIASLRPVLESVFHRILLYPAPEYRLNALNGIMEIIQNPNRLLDLTCPLYQEDEASTNDLSLLLLIMDSMEESSDSNYFTMEACVLGCHGLLKALEEISLGRYISANIANIICEMYPNLEDCDYYKSKIYLSTTTSVKTIKKERQSESELHHNNDSLKWESYESVSSEGTEGPEEEKEKDSESEVFEKNEMQTLQENSIFSSISTFKVIERQKVKHFIAAFDKFLLLLVPMKSSIQIDQNLQNFASRYCEGISNEPIGKEYSVICADAIYLAAYSALMLDVELFHSSFYTSLKRKKNITEEYFLIKAESIGILNYFSRVWCRELYQIIAASSFLEKHGFYNTNHHSQSHALINLIIDIEGLGSCLRGSQMLWACRRLEKPAKYDDDNSEIKGGLRLGRRILTCCLDSVLKILATPLNRKRCKSKSSKFQNFKFLGNDFLYKTLKQTITMSIEGLQTLTQLCNNFGLQNKCGDIVKLLTKVACSDFNEKKNRIIRLHTINNNILYLTTCHALTLELLLSSGLELGSHCPDCWPHILHCCTYVKKLEHNYFSQFKNRNLNSSIKLIRKENNMSTYLNTNSDFEKCTSVDLHNFFRAQNLPQNVSDIVSSANGDSNGFLNSSEMAKVICALSQRVEKLFEDAASKLNLKSLESFSSALCLFSHKQLFSSASGSDKSKHYWWQRFTSKAEVLNNNSLLLDTIGEIMLKCVRSGRPILHIMRIWAIIGPHLMEAACHRDLTVSKKAIKHIHDVINTVLAEHTELPYFHINESLFKPFENLLHLDLCEPDIQDQIVSCICEFVEANFREIRSGWRPLFGALRAVSINSNILMYVFRVFLETGNMLVFSYAAIDYIKCLLKHLKAQTTCEKNKDITLELIKYLKNCEDILSSICKMPQRIAFHSAHDIKVSDGNLVDPFVPDFEVLKTNYIFRDLLNEWEKSYALTYFSSLECNISLDALDDSSGVLKVWFLLLEGIYSTIISSEPNYQSFLLDMLYTDLTELIDNPGPVFGLFVFNRLILPMTQCWLRQSSKIPESDVTGLKHSIGLLSDVVLQYFNSLKNNSSSRELLNLLINQAFLVLSECCIHPISTVASMGPACIRHIILSLCRNLNEEQWRCVIIALRRTCIITLAFLRLITESFSRNLESYFNDCSRVKVVAKEDEDPKRIYIFIQLLHRVFVYDEENIDLNYILNKSSEDHKMYNFFVYNNREDFIQISVKSLVISLQAHQSILQIISDILLQGSELLVSSMGKITINNIHVNSNERTKSNNSNKPELLNHLQLPEIHLLLSCLDCSYNCAIAFDSCLNLKCFIQKIIESNKPANLYRQTVVSRTVKFASLFEYCLFFIGNCNLNADDINMLLKNADGNLDNDVRWFLNQFQECFYELCETYIKFIQNSHSKNSPQKNKNEFLLKPQEKNFLSTNTENCNDNKIKDEEENLKLFKLLAFSDFSLQSSNNNLAEDEESVNEIVKSRDIEMERNDILKEYKLKKNAYSKAFTNLPQDSKIFSDLEIERRNCISKDGELLHRVWTEMLSSVLRLLQGLCDADFQKILPLIYNGVRLLKGYISESVLNKIAPEFFHRIAILDDNLDFDN